MTGRELLQQLLQFDSLSPSLLDEELVLTFGNDSNGNAEPIPIVGESLLPAGDERVNGLTVDPANLVLLLDDEGKEDNRVTCDHLTVYYVPSLIENPERPQLSKPYIVDHDGPTEGDSTGFRFNTPHNAADHVREWLYKQEDP